MIEIVGWTVRRSVEMLVVLCAETRLNSTRDRAGFNAGWLAASVSPSQTAKHGPSCHHQRGRVLDVTPGWGVQPYQTRIYAHRLRGGTKKEQCGVKKTARRDSCWLSTTSPRRTSVEPRGINICSFDTPPHFLRIAWIDLFWMEVRWFPGTDLCVGG